MNYNWLWRWVNNDRYMMMYWVKMYWHRMKYWWVWMVKRRMVVYYGRMKYRVRVKHRVRMHHRVGVHKRKMRKNRMCICRWTKIHWWSKEGWKPRVVGDNMGWPVVVYVDGGESRLRNLVG